MINEYQPFKYYTGIRNLAETLQGYENIYLGIRPYGFHAANSMVLAAYPYLLCESFEKLGKTPKFNLHVFINDWEQDKVDGIDPKQYPFNLIPDKTTFQYTPDPDGDKFSNIVDRWQPVIEKEVLKLQKYFPLINIKFIRNSELKTHPIMKQTLIATLRYPNLVADTLRKHGSKDVLDGPVSYANAVCSRCFSARGSTMVSSEGLILVHCIVCGWKKSGNYEEFNYWFYHKPLALPRLKIFDIDVCITGLEHYMEGDYEVRHELVRAYGMEIKPFKTLYAPLVKAEDGRPMGKSKGNAKSVPFEDLLPILRNFDGTEFTI